MSFRKIAVQLLIVLNFVTAIPAAHSQQGNLRGPKNTTPRYSEPQRQPQQQQQQPPTRRVTQSGTYGPIVSSDTLWQIAQNYRPNNSLSIYQVMQAIYELNPTAFDQQNLNLLKDGSILIMPQESYISGINTKQAQDRSERDTQNLPSSTSNQLKQQVTSAAFDQTKELLEQKLGAIDKAQNRQFIAIRKQFAESINGVQSILDENKNLFERLDKVNADINEMRSEEEKKSLQMNQMGKSIEELLEKSRQDDAEKAALLAQTETSLLDNPITLILLFTLPVLLILVGFAYWMIKRNSPSVVQSEDDDIEDISLDPLTAEMDDLSDALSAELSGESSDELEDDSLFGDDDLLDDVLSEELEESLDDALEDSIEEPLLDGPELFDELGDDELEEEFEVGADVVEQDDLDSLFDEDDDLLAEVDNVISADMTDDSVDDLLTEVQESDVSADMLIEEDDQVVANIDDKEYKEDDSLLTTVEVDDKATTHSIVDEQEQPEISIDDLLNIPEEDVIENPFIDDSKEINEEVLQDIDKEISSQNTDLDSVTGTLLDELEQVEQMRSMLPDDDDDDDDDDDEEEEEEEEDEDEDEKSQLDIQKLDHLAQQIDEDLLADDLSTQGTDDSVEVDMSDILNETIQSEGSDDLVQSEPAVETKASVESATVVEAKESIEPEPAVETKASVQPEQAEVSVEPEPAVEAKESIEPEPAVEAEASVEPEPNVEAQAIVEPVQPEQAEEPAEPEPDVESDEPESNVETEEPVVETDGLAEPEPDVEAEALVEPEPDVEAEALAEPEPEPDVEAEALAEPEPDVEAEALAEPEQDVEAEALAEPEPDVEAQASVEPEPDVEAEALAEPEPDVEAETLAESEQDVDNNIDEDDWFDTETNADQEFDVPNGSNSVLDEDQLDKALEDFENEELDEVLENTTSNAATTINPLDDLAFSADDFIAKEYRSEPAPLPTLDGIESIGGSDDSDDSDDSEDFDDSELENAFNENVDDLSLESPQNSNDGLDDLPGLGDWLDEGEAKPDKQTKDTIEALEESSFDEMLESIDFDDDLSVAEENDTGFDIATLLDETAQNTDVNDPDTEDFLDVEALLNESLSAESEDEIDTALNLEFPLEPFINEQDNLKMIDVDADDGLGAKLDLAHAYIEIGEEESAKELLDEILNKGSAEQITAVKTILDKLN